MHRRIGVSETFNPFTGLSPEAQRVAHFGTDHDNNIQEQRDLVQSDRSHGCSHDAATGFTRAMLKVWCCRGV